MFDDTILKSFATMGVAVAFLSAILFFMKFLVKKNRMNNSINNTELKIISKTTLQPKHHLYIVKANNKELLLGVTDQNINLIADLSCNKEKFNDELMISNNKIIPTNKIIKKKENTPITDDSLSFKNFLMSSFKKNN